MTRDKIPDIRGIKKSKSAMYSNGVMFSKHLSEKNAAACIADLDAMQKHLDDLQILLSKAVIGDSESFKSTSNGINMGGFESKLVALIDKGLKPSWLRSLREKHKSISDSGVSNQSITLRQMGIVTPAAPGVKRTGYIWKPGPNYDTAIHLLPKIEKLIHDRESRLRAIEIRRQSCVTPEKQSKYDNEAIIAGIVYEFAGFLSGLEKEITVGCNHSPSMLCDTIREWAEQKGMDLSDGSKIGNWEEFFLRDKKCNPGKPS